MYQLCSGMCYSNNIQSISRANIMMQYISCLETRPVSPVTGFPEEAPLLVGESLNWLCQLAVVAALHDGIRGVRKCLVYFL